LKPVGALEEDIVADIARLIWRKAKPCDLVFHVDTSQVAVAATVAM
jgi:hypothetical protein